MSSRTTRPVKALAALVVLLAVAAGLIAFEPWKAFTDTTVQEALPPVAAPSTMTTAAPSGMVSPTAEASMPGPAMSGAPMSTTPMPATPMPAAPTPAAPVSAAPAQLVGGAFQSGEHRTTGRARLLRLADGGTVLRLEDLATSEGPDVRVYLSTRPAAVSKLEDLGPAPLELGRLKGNLGNQNYTVPAGTDLTRFHSAVIWCKRFSVGFGAADLTAMAG
ncbi:DM13 domain-containing protein [Kitasatospora sp. NPDC096147]|uniref:DM13 domain-containing protein n=1 Tax=Kitasatospora sp. NPDC096147 TaxID=3364093 RepID=UPI00381E7C04